MLIDTHAHLYWDSYNEDFDQVIDRAHQVGLTTIINIGTDLTTNQQALSLHSDKIKFFSTLGLHPHEGSADFSKDKLQVALGEMELLAIQNPQKIVAVGECGLDFYFSGDGDFVPIGKAPDKLIAAQKELYKQQVNLAKKLNLPLVIHCRDAWDSIFISDLADTKGVFHTFTGNLSQAQTALELGYYLAFSCIVTYPKNESLRQILKQVPIEKILTETDSPFLPPQSLRGKRNEPANVIEVVKVIAEIKNISLDKAANQTFQNAADLFQLKNY